MTSPVTYRNLADVLRSAKSLPSAGCPAPRDYFNVTGRVDKTPVEFSFTPNVGCGRQRDVFDVAARTLAAHGDSPCGRSGNEWVMDSSRGVGTFMVYDVKGCG